MPMTSDLAKRLRSLFDEVEALNPQGLDLQHATICTRRCWLHMKRAHFNDWSEHVRRGEARHAASHPRDKSVQGLDGLRPDWLDWKSKLVTEEKASASHPVAAANQVVFYAVVMSIATDELWSARIYLSTTIPLGARVFES